MTVVIFSTQETTHSMFQLTTVEELVLRPMRLSRIARSCFVSPNRISEAAQYRFQNIKKEPLQRSDQHAKIAKGVKRFRSPPLDCTISSLELTYFSYQNIPHVVVSFGVKTGSLLLEASVSRSRVSLRGALFGLMNQAQQQAVSFSLR